MASFVRPLLYLPSLSSRPSVSRRWHLKLLAGAALLSDAFVEARHLRAEMLKRYPHLRDG